MITGVVPARNVDVLPKKSGAADLDEALDSKHDALEEWIASLTASHPDGWVFYLHAGERPDEEELQRVKQDSSSLSQRETGVGVRVAAGGA